MSKLDVANAQIGYLKLWLGIMVVTDVSMMGWLASNLGGIPGYRIALTIVVIATIAYAAYKTHRNIERRIESLEEL